MEAPETPEWTAGPGGLPFLNLRGFPKDDYPTGARREDAVSAKAIMQVGRLDRPGWSTAVQRDGPLARSYA